jgi:hypothetical protein
MVRRGVTLHRLPHNVRVHTWPFLPGVIKRLHHTICTLLIQRPVHLRESQLEANQKCAFHAIDCEKDKTVAGLKSPQLPGCAKTFIVSVAYFAVRANQIQTIAYLAGTA